VKLPGILLSGLVPATNKNAMGSTLPWPNGSILTGRLENIAAGTATLVIASRHFQANIPASILAHLPQGQLWLELISREAPAKFRILSRQQAINEIAGRLAEIAASKQPDIPIQQRHTQSSWQWQSQHPLHAYASDNGQRLILDERDSHQPRGMIERHSDADGFALHGRIDLERLGTFFFALQQQSDQAPQLKLRAVRHDAFIQLGAPFNDWLATRQEHGGSGIQQALQAEFSEGDEPILQPRPPTARHG